MDYIINVMEWNAQNLQPFISISLMEFTIITTIIDSYNFAKIKLLTQKITGHKDNMGTPILTMFKPDCHLPISKIYNTGFNFG